MGACEHLRRTRAWKAAGGEPSALLDALPAVAHADAWAGSWARPPAQQGLTVLGTCKNGRCGGRALLALLARLLLVAVAAAVAAARGWACRGLRTQRSVPLVLFVMLTMRCR